MDQFPAGTKVENKEYLRVAQTKMKAYVVTPTDSERKFVWQQLSDSTEWEGQGAIITRIIR